MGSTYSLDAGMGELHTGPKHALSGADPKPYFDLHVVAPDANQKERVTACSWHSITRLSLDGRGSLTLFGCPIMGRRLR